MIDIIFCATALFLSIYCLIELKRQGKIIDEQISSLKNEIEQDVEYGSKET